MIERDSLFVDAARIVVLEQSALSSLLQRRLKLGFNRADRILEQLQAEGIVGAKDEATGNREIYIKGEIALINLLKGLELDASDTIYSYDDIKIKSGEPIQKKSRDIDNNVLSNSEKLDLSFVPVESTKKKKSSFSISSIIIVLFLFFGFFFSFGGSFNSIFQSLGLHGGIGNYFIVFIYAGVILLIPISYILRNSPIFKQIWWFWKTLFIVGLINLGLNFFKKEFKEWWKKN